MPVLPAPWAALGLFFLAACAPPPAAAPAAALPVTVTLSLPGDQRQMILQGSRVFGPSIELTHRDQTYRGRAFNRPIDLRVDDDRIEGAVGGRTDLHIEEQDNSFTLRGLNASQLGRLEVGPQRVVGQLGGCQYDLQRTGPHNYQGLRTCSTRLEPAALSFAPAVAALPSRDRAALLAILLTP
jgi:hypothetical protein